MFNSFCWFLNVIGLPGLAAWLRRRALALLAPWARRWEYTNMPCAGYRGGVDVPVLGTVAFIPEGNADVPYVYLW